MIDVILARLGPAEDARPVSHPMRLEHPTCVNQDVHGTGGTNREVAPIERPAVGKGTARGRARKVRFGSRRVGQKSMEAANNQQAADIEDTFSVRWEW